MVENKWSWAPAGIIMKERSEKSNNHDEHLTPSQRYGVISQKEYMEITGNRVVLNLSGQDNMKHVEPGDFIIHLRSFQGGIELSEVKGKVSNAYTVLRPTTLCNKGFYKWFMKSSFLIDNLITLTDQLRDGQSINYSRFSRLSLPLPSLETQQRIADFLDRETTQIDDNVSNLNAYVELLKQRRQVLITDAVTGRIDSNGKRTNTDIKSSKFMIGQVFSLRSDQVDSKDFQPLSVGKRGVTLQLEKVAKSGKTDGRKLVRKGDIVINSRSDRRGSAGLSNYEGSVSLIYIVLEPKNNFIDSTFAHHLIRSKWFQEEFYKYGTGIVDDLWTTRYDRMAQIQLSIPPLDEQKRIADYLDRETAEIDALIEDSTRLRDLLLKRRQVLITEVVTGKKEV